MVLHTVYTGQEYADMHFYHGCTDGNSLEAEWLYKEKFMRPNHPVHQRRCIPHHNTFTALRWRLTNTGSVFTKTKERGVTYKDETDYAELEESIIDKVQRNPCISVRDLSIPIEAVS